MSNVAIIGICIVEDEIPAASAANGDGEVVVAIGLGILDDRDLAAFDVGKGTGDGFTVIHVNGRKSAAQIDTGCVGRVSGDAGEGAQVPVGHAAFLNAVAASGNNEALLIGQCGIRIVIEREGTDGTVAGKAEILCIVRLGIFDDRDRASWLGIGEGTSDFLTSTQRNGCQVGGDDNWFTRVTG